MTKLFFKPTFIQLEPTNFCNLSCVLCPVGQGTLQRERGNMSFDIFKDIVHGHAQSLAYVVLYNIGEPFLNSDVFDMIRFAVSKKIFVKLSTNGVLKDEGAIDKILDSGVDEILISLDFADRDLYRKFKGKDLFDRVVRNIRTLILKRGDRKSPFIVVQFLMTRDNEKRRGILFNLYRATGADKMIIKKVRIDQYEQGGNSDVLPIDKRYIRESYLDGHGMRARSCLRPWVSVNILWEGTVVPCCFDINCVYPLGNIRTQSFAQIWNGACMINFRSTLLNNAQTANMCSHCSAKKILGNFIRFNFSKYNARTN